jgi:hypothetical protein
VALEPIGEKLSHWEEYLSQPQLREIFAKQLEVKLLESSLRENFDSLCEFDKIFDQLNEEERRVIEKIRETLPEPNEDRWLEIFDNSLRIAWIDHIEQKFPVLRTVSSQKFTDVESELRQCISDKFKLSNEILLMKSRERVYKNVEYNRLNNRVTYRDLFHQVTKKRRIWPVRKLIANFPREIFDLVPCWLASPESVSAIFPMEKIFDLVIFDEASQCFVEKGIPAIFRGKQVVVAGDDKQLRPNDLYQVRWEDQNEEDVAELDFDSLLNLSNQYLMQVHLNGHYRSKNLDLIRFSNDHFYKGRLTMLPDFYELNHGAKAIDYVHVQGIWEKNTNQEEAEKVAFLVKELLAKNPKTEIGIVTFNAQQQMFILDYLDDFALANDFLIPDSLIVKNIENVQGDEKDVIIFSTVYAPDFNGKLKLQFGSLNMEGGENRLNVAITRAREKIYLVTSIMPQQMKVEDTKNNGPKLLAKYLEYAYKISNQEADKYEINATDHSPDWYLSAKIQNLKIEGLEHLDLNHNLPFVDLTVTEKDKYLGAILTDDGIYHQAISIKDSHAYKFFVLNQKNWPNVSFFSRQYWINPDQIIGAIKHMIGRSELKTRP